MERGRRVRRRLLAAAVELIPERGWTAVSTRVLAERAGVTPSVVHYHFPSLPAVLNEAAIDLMRRVLAESTAAMDTSATPAEAVNGLLAALDEYTGADPTSLLFIEAYLAATRDEELRERISELVGDFRLRLGRWLGERGVAAPEETAAVLAAAIDGLLLHRGLSGAPDAGLTRSVLRRLVDEHVTTKGQLP